MNKAVDERDLVRALTRGLDVILAFSHHRPRMSLSEVASETGLSRPTARRLLLTLQQNGYVTTDGRMFALTPRVLALGYAYLSSLNLTHIAQPFMQELMETTREGVALATLDLPDVVYVTRVSAYQIANMTLATGTRLPAHATSLGQVLLADLAPGALSEYLAKAALQPMTSRTITAPDQLIGRLDQVRAQGWALVDQELEEGLRSISAPVRGPNGSVIAAMGLSTTTATVNADRLEHEFLPALLKAAAITSAQLGAGYS